VILSAIFLQKGINCQSENADYFFLITYPATNDLPYQGNYKKTQSKYRSALSFKTA
jgi:hypothetical protein